MSYRQYVGARYVPMYAGSWDSSRNYEPLTIVNDGNGNSYTSKKDVPAGVPLSDRDYWAQTGSYSGAIQNLQDEVNAINDRINKTPFTTPEAFGAVGDGLNDDTVALRSCIAHAVDTGKNVRMTGRYKITDSIEIYGAVNFYGGTIIESFPNAPTSPSATLTNIITVASSYVGFYGVTFKGSLYGKNQVDFVHVQRLISVENSNNVVFDGCKFIAPDAMYTISFVWSNNCVVRNCYFTYTRYIAVAFFNQSNGGEIANCQFDEIGLTINQYRDTYFVCLSSWTGYKGGTVADFCKHVRCENNFFQCNVTQNQWEFIDTHGGEDIVVANNVLIGVAIGIMFGSEINRGFEVNGYSIVNNLIQCRAQTVPSYTQVIVAGGYRGLIAGNVVYNSGRANGDTERVSCFVNLTQYGQYITIKDNVLYDMYGDFIRVGVYADSVTKYTQRITIDGNNIVGFTVNTPNTPCRLIVFNYPNLTGNTLGYGSVFSNNKFTRGYADLLFDMPTVDGAALRVVDNVYERIPTISNFKQIAPDVVRRSDVSNITAGYAAHMVRVSDAVSGGVALLIHNGTAYVPINAA